MKKYIREILWGAFALYCVFLLWILFFSREAKRWIPINEYIAEYSSIVPFRTTLKYIKFICRKQNWDSFRLAFYNIGGNLILFLPMGFFLPLLFPRMRKFSRIMLNIGCMIFMTEILQALLRLGIPDVDDVIFNFIGAWVGYGINKRFSEYISIVP
ncbi:MAG: VanZ family protein [Clostridia bacterium]|nr:VanZ family protein [Clostridia bacterium]